tara:strand:+ start:1720 stop:2043 length:324 start_codon:yes stop_codon:yes gene_type:complete
MAFTAYHKITGSTGVDVELLAPGSGVNNLRSIMITNVHATADATVSLFLQKDTSTTSFFIIHTIAIPADSSLLLDDKALLGFDNSDNAFGLYITVGSSDTVDILLNV